MLVSSVIAIAEKRPLAIQDEKNWVHELYQLIKTLDVVHTLEGIRAGVHVVAENVSPSAAYILILDSKESKVEVIGFDSNDKASEWYKEMEHETIDKAHIQAVQVSVDSVAALRQAYPNYYLDTSRFIEILHALMRVVENPERSSRPVDAHLLP